MRLIIAGGRNYRLTTEDRRRLDEIRGVQIVISGGATGADHGGEQWAASRGIPVRRFPADWKTFGPAAGPIRNSEMARNADAAVLFPGGDGTADMHEKAVRARLQVFDWRTPVNTTQTPAPPPKVVRCPFTVVIDSNETLPYTFQGLWDGPKGGPKSKLIQVPTTRLSLRHNGSEGDYSIEGMIERITIERKSKSDLYGSMHNEEKRLNFIHRLEVMSRMDFAAVVVEAEWLELLTDPPPHTEFRPKSLARTIQAWMVRYPVHWLMAPSRQHAEAFTFRLLQRYWLDQRERPRERFHPGTVDEPLSDPDEEDTR